MITQKSSDASPFLIIFRNAGPDTHAHLTPEQRTQLMQQWNNWYEDLSAKGKVQHGHPLALEGRVVSMEQGRITDGPYAETKEAIGGYLFLTVADLAEATAIAKQCPGLPLGLTIEVRPIGEGQSCVERRERSLVVEKRTTHSGSTGFTVSRSDAQVSENMLN